MWIWLLFLCNEVHNISSVDALDKVTDVLDRVGQDNTVIILLILDCTWTWAANREWVRVDWCKTVVSPQFWKVSGTYLESFVGVCRHGHGCSCHLLLHHSRLVCSCSTRQAQWVPRLPNYPAPLWKSEHGKALIAVWGWACLSHLVRESGKVQENQENCS